MTNKITFNNKAINIFVDTYYNGRIRLMYGSENERNNITLDLKKVYLNADKVAINPEIIKNNLFHTLIKYKIIKNIVSSITYKNKEIPICSINLGVLRKYDLVGVNKYLKRRGRYAK